METLSIEDRMNGLGEDQDAFTKADVQEAIRLAQMVGKTVTRTSADGRVQVGTLESVYVTDGLAANVMGLVDWSEQGKDYGRDFSMGPLYGDKIDLCPDPWYGFEGGRIVKVYPSEMEASRDLYARKVAMVAPLQQGPR